MDFLAQFPGTPRPIQQEILGILGERWGDHSAFAVQAAVATGKSRIAVAIARSVGAAIVTPTNILTQQYADEFDDLDVLHAAARYPSHREFLKSRQAAVESRKLVANYYTYVANTRHGIRKPVVVVDEAHRVLEMQVARHSHRIWGHQFGFGEFGSVGEWLEWAESKDHPKLAKLAALVRSGDYVLDQREGLFRGRPQLCIDVLPVTVRRQAPWLWGHRTQKVVLLSATLSTWEVSELGLNNRRTLWVEGGSPIPAANRMIRFDPVCDMRYARRDRSVSALTARLRHELNTRQGKGVIHATYDVAARLQASLRHPRLITHTPETTWSAYRKFLASDNGVFLASGLTEGIDLKGDRARWQVVCQVPFPSLADPTVSAQLEHDSKLYQWFAVKTLLQTFGRVSRAPDDWGETLILDAQFERLYRSAQDMFPDYVRESISGLDSVTQRC